jgi:hypothetical protein
MIIQETLRTSRWFTWTKTQHRSSIAHRENGHHVGGRLFEGHETARQAVRLWSDLPQLEPTRCCLIGRDACVARGALATRVRLHDGRERPNCFARKLLVRVRLGVKLWTANVDLRRESLRGWLRSARGS